MQKQVFDFQKLNEVFEEQKKNTEFDLSELLTDPKKEQDFLTKVLETPKKIVYTENGKLYTTTIEHDPMDKAELYARISQLYAIALKTNSDYINTKFILKKARSVKKTKLEK